MTIEEALQKYGLKVKEAKVYLALLELGTANVSEIAKRSGLIRSTTYSILEALGRQGLILTVEKGKIQHYIAEDPQKLVANTRERLVLLEQAAPEIQTLYRGAATRPKVRYYEGVKGLREMYDEETLKGGVKEYQIIASDEAWMRMDHTFLSHYKSRRAKAGIKTRLILEHGPEGLKAKKNGARYLSEVKLLPKDFPWKITSGVYIFPHKVIFVGYEGPQIAVVVHSKQIADEQRAVFEFMWKMLK